MSEDKKSKTVNMGNGIQYHKNPNLNDLPISEKARESLKKHPTGEVITIDSFTPFALEKITVRVVFENMPTSKATVLLDLFKDIQKESQILTDVNENKLTQSDAEELIRNVRIEKATDEMVKWKMARNKEQNLPWDQRAGHMFNRFCKKLKRDPLQYSELANVDKRKEDFFIGIERSMKGENVF